MTPFKQMYKKLTKKITIIIVPDAQGTVKQVRLLKSAVFALLFFLIAVGIYLTSSSLILLIGNRQLLVDNLTYTNTLSKQENSLALLEDIVDEQRKQIAALEVRVAQSDDYFISKVEQVSALEGQLNSIVGLFSERTDLNLSVPTSRSKTLNTALLSENSTLEDLTASSLDQTTAHIEAHLNAYTELASEIESTLDFLDAKPDLMPTQGSITSKFGNRRDPFTRRITFHKGIDIATRSGSAIKAAGSGVVTFSGWSGSYGRVIVISHGYGYKSVYAHNSSNDVRVGDHVTKGQVIGKVGSSGKSTGPHLHFEIHFNGTEINPLKLVN
jgi:murein DD-endopeptidase MepM/ murein hydrolase activator NlpD